MSASARVCSSPPLYKIFFRLEEPQEKARAGILNSKIYCAELRGTGYLLSWALHLLEHGIL